jgi:hypothetical protein
MHHGGHSKTLTPQHDGTATLRYFECRGLTSFEAAGNEAATERNLGMSHGHCCYLASYVWSFGTGLNVEFFGAHQGKGMHQP